MKEGSSDALRMQIFSRRAGENAMKHQENILQVLQDILDSAWISIPELRVELALMLNEQKRLSIGKARELAGMTLREFRQVLCAHRIMPH